MSGKNTVSFCVLCTRLHLQVGMCGNAATDNPQTWSVPGNPVAVYTEGQQIDVSIVITGRFGLDE